MDVDSFYPSWWNITWRSDPNKRAIAAMDAEGGEATKMDGDLAHSEGEPVSRQDYTLARLAQLIADQAQQASARDDRMVALLDAALSQGAREPQRASQPTKQTSINVERPIWDATATFADFTTWKESWEDFVRCQHLRSHDRETRVTVLRQSLDEELRRYIRQDIICISEEDDDDAIIGAIEASS